jgi:DUF971 family protein
MIFTSPVRLLARASAEPNPIRHPDGLDTAWVTLLEMIEPARIDVEGGTRVVLSWEDQTQTAVTARTLRAACQCADCRSEAGASRMAAMLGGPVEIRIETARLVGAYAVNFEFAPDSHRTGIFTFDQLRQLGSTKRNSAR